MSNPFDYVKSITSTKESLYSNEELFQKEYVSFMVNRSLSNSHLTVLFCDIINQYQHLDKKLQYDFYINGVPKRNDFTKWVKKEETNVSEDLVTFVCTTLKISISRALSVIKLIGEEAIKFEMGKRGGRV
jgi:hypothetical protein